MKIGIIAAALAFVGLSAVAQTNQKTNMDMKQLELVQEWDKTFPKSDKVEHSKVVFVNRFGVTLAADMYVPKEVVGKLPAVAVSGPFGAVKEQSSGLYAQALAERGFLTIAFDPSFTGESGGVPRNVASPDINTEDFSAAVDFLANEDRVDPERIGILGICGWGGFAINAAANDTRIKATVASTMYDISRCTANGYFDQADNADARYEMRRRLNAQRTKIIGTVRMSVQEGWSIRFRPMRRSLYAIIMLITKLPEVITPVRSIPRRGGMRPPTSLF